MNELTLVKRDPDKPPAAAATRSSRLAGFMAKHWSSAVIVMLLAVAAAATRLYHIGDYPGIYGDEATYMNQAWSVLTLGKLAPYVYWYDHPPFGWIQLAGWLAITGGLARYSELTVMAGREYMVVMAMATAALLYILARRLGYRRPFAVLASLLWILSPLALSYSRMVLLDNIVQPWLLGAMVLVLTPARNLRVVTAGAVCFGAACLSKEAALLAMPAVVYLVWQNFRSTANTRPAVWRLLWVSGAVMSLYPLTAVVYGELEGFWNGQVVFQLFSRYGTGSPLQPGSQAYNVVHTMWLPLDSWLPWAGLAAILPALLIKKLRGPAIALAAYAAMFFRSSGYLPVPFIIALLPFMALLVAGLCEVCWPSREMFRSDARRRRQAVGGVAVVAVVAAGFALLGGVRSWYDSYAYEATTQDTQYQRQAVAWTGQNLSPDDIVVAEPVFWLDVVNSGLPRDHVIMPFSIDHDPTAVQKIGGADNVDYLILSAYTLQQNQDAQSYPTIFELAGKSQVVATFGADGDYRQVTILKVPTSSG